MKLEKEAIKKVEIFAEFLVFGIIIGIVEDLIAVKLTTGDMITWTMVGIIVLVTIPFAIIGELIVDNIDFATKLYHFIRHKEQKHKDKMEK